MMSPNTLLVSNPASRSPERQLTFAIPMGKIVRKRLVVAGVCVLMALCSTAGLAQWTDDTSANTPLTPLSEREWDHQSVSDGLGGTITSLNTQTNPGDFDNVSVVMQRLDGDGLPIWGSNGIVLTSNSHQYAEHQLISDGAGGAFVAWTSETPTSTRQIWAQHIGANGAALWGPGGVDVCIIDSEQRGVQMVPDGAGGMIIAWNDIAGSFYGVFAQRIDGAGNLIWNSSGQQVSIENIETLELQLAPGSVPGSAALIWMTRNGLFRSIRAQILDASGARVFDAASVTISPTTEDYLRDTRVCSDGAGGYYAVWVRTSVSGEVRVWTVHMLASGTPNYAGSLGGRHLKQAYPQLVSDGAGGAFVQSSDYDLSLGLKRLCLHHLTFDLPLWGTQGAHVADLGSDADEAGHFLVADGAGGMYSGWNGGAIDGNQIQHIAANGTPLWPENRPAFTIRIVRGFSGLIPDGNGHVVALFTGTNGTFFQSSGYAQRLDANGFPTDTAFAALSATDRPNDQGGELVLSWQKSPLDSFGQGAVANYSYWVRPQVAKSGANNSGAEATGQVNAPVLPDAELAKLLNLDSAQLSGAKAGGWTYAGLVPAVGADDYSAFCPTYGDSTDAGITYSDFKVLAHHPTPGVFWETENVLAGYSVDNLSPGAPLNLTGLPNTGVVDLAWYASGANDQDLREYHIYRGDFSGFPVDAAHLILATSALFEQDLTAGGNVWYRVTAVDAHGNEGSASNEVAVSLSVSAVASVPDAFQYRGNYPNPFNPATHIAFDLPRESAVELTIFSVDGGHIATLVNGTMSAGNHRVLWNGLDSSGRGVASGVYYARLQTERETAVGKMTLVR